ncbi:MAG: peptide deformylase [Microgenomates group bacterium]
MSKILTLPNPILRQKAKPVEKIDAEVKKLVAEMIKTLRPKPRKLTGVGLAAPQLGKSLRIIVVWSRHSRKFLPMINPKIIWHSRRTRLGVPESKNPYEGCLSVPGVWGKVRRYSVIKVRYQNLKGTEIVRKFKGFTGVVVQHEVDHLEGILFVDRIKEQKGKIIMKNPN